MYKSKLPIILAACLLLLPAAIPVYADDADAAQSSAFRGGAGSTALDSGDDSSVKSGCPDEPPEFDPYDTVDSFFICLGSTIFDTIRVIDPDSYVEYIHIYKITGPGEFSSTTMPAPAYGYYSYMPTEDGSFEVLYRATSNLGDTVEMTKTYHVFINDPPEFTNGGTIIDIAAPGSEVTYDIEVTDFENDPITFTMVSGSGVIDPVTGVLSFTPETPGTYSFEIEAADTCNVISTTLTFNVGEGFELVCPDAEIYEFICQPETLCYKIDGIPDGADVTVWPASAWYDEVSSSLCFYTNCSVDKELKITVQSGQLADSCEFVVHVTLNSVPLVILAPDTAVAFCEPTEVCIPVGVTDVDNNITAVEVWPLGVYNAVTGTVCFTPSESGQQIIYLKAIDECETEDYDSVIVDVEINTPPVVEAPETIDTVVCDFTSICIPVEITDTEDNITSVTVAPTGTYDSENQLVCFIPTEVGSYELTVAAEDACGEITSAVVIINVSLGETAVIDCPAEPMYKKICEPQTICFDLNIIPVDAAVELSYGGYIDGQVCFMADTAGIYHIDITAEALCGADECTVTYVVEMGETAAIDCPVGPIDYTICEPTEFCYDLDILPLDASVTVSYGTYSDGQLCFMADTAGMYVIDVTAAAECGSDDCQITFIVDQGPVAEIDCPVESIAHTICEPTEFCYDLAILPLDASVMVSYGSYQDGQLCFTADTVGTYVIDVTAEAECGSDECQLTFIIEQGPVAEIDCPDIIEPYTICEPTEICYDLAISPLDAEVSLNYGVYRDGQVCFTADTVGIYTIEVTATAMCGSDVCVLEIPVEIGETAAIDCPDIIDPYTICEPTEFCYDLAILPLDAAVTASYGTYQNGQLCFTADTAGTYIIDVTAEAECGADECQLTFVVEQGPVAEIDCPEIIDTYTICDLTEICLDLPIMPLDAEVSLNYGEYRDGQVCFTADTAGLYIIEVTATAECGSDACTLEIPVEIGETAEIECPVEPIAHTICEPTEFCYDLAVLPLDAEVTVSYGTYQDGRLCFMADTSGTYVIDITAEAECGSDECQLTFVIDQGPVAEIECPVEPIAYSICGPTEFCYDLAILPLDAAVTVSYGTYQDGQLCFTADTAGTYIIDVTAEAECGWDNCQITFIVDQGPVAEIDCPDIIDLYTICEPTEICLDLAIMPLDAEVSLNYGEYRDGQVCFTADTADYILSRLPPPPNAAPMSVSSKSRLR